MPTASFRTAGSGPQHRVLDMTHSYKATAVESGGRFLLFELTVPPGSGAPPHSHEEDSEFFYLLEGRLTFETPLGRHEAGPGDSCWAPAGDLHAFRNGTEAPARALVLVTPGVAAERFFAGIDARAGAAVDPEALAALAAGCGIRLAAPA